MLATIRRGRPHQRRSIWIAANGPTITILKINPSFLVTLVSQQSLLFFFIQSICLILHTLYHQSPGAVVQPVGTDAFSACAFAMYARTRSMTPEFASCALGSYARCITRGVVIMGTYVHVWTLSMRMIDGCTWTTIPRSERSSMRSPTAYSRSIFLFRFTQHREARVSYKNGHCPTTQNSLLCVRCGRPTRQYASTRF